ncbi:MAG: hypothetical protein HDS96_05380 [Bacteroidales bacterium]|nr:hypothetical protein [Bacteroidales bacterium]
MNISTNKTLAVVCWPLIKICEWMGRNTPETLVKIRYFARFHRLPRLQNPKDLNEKILWMKLYADTTRWTELADKYKVRNYVEGLGLGKYLVKLYGKWDTAESVDFSTLPPNLIFKANNGDGKGTNIIVRDLPTANHKELRQLFRTWLNRKNIGELAAEPQYKNMPPCIIAEELLPLPEGAKSVVDYKIWCINGVARYIRAYTDRHDDGGGADVMTYDTDWNPRPETMVKTSHFHQGKVLPKPKNLDEMLKVAEKLSAGFPILRVDMYNIDGKIYFGELTFTSQGGMMNNLTSDFLEMLGRDADLSMVKLKS